VPRIHFQYNCFIQLNSTSYVHKRFNYRHSWLLLFRILGVPSSKVYRETGHPDWITLNFLASCCVSRYIILCPYNTFSSRWACGQHSDSAINIVLIEVFPCLPQGNGDNYFVLDDNYSLVHTSELTILVFDSIIR
jgi:hypothetical protein